MPRIGTSQSSSDKKCSKRNVSLFIFSVCVPFHQELLAFIFDLIKSSPSNEYWIFVSIFSPSSELTFVYRFFGRFRGFAVRKRATVPRQSAKKLVRIIDPDRKRQQNGVRKSTKSYS